MFYVYVLKSQKYNWKYIGYCIDLRKRFLEHNLGRVKSTKARKPYNLVYYEVYNDKTAALKREIELKRNSNKKEELFKRILEN